MIGYIALGSNLGDRGANLAAALRRLSASGLPPYASSTVWETEPVDSPSPRWFWNMAVEVRTDRPPLELLDTLLSIERQAGRERTERNAPRPIDLDLLWLGGIELEHDRLSLPHPRMWRRRFVLGPLAEIAPDLVNEASGRSVAEELDALPRNPRAQRLGALASCGRLPL
ncbi:MAG TPA: 2-amino-4-hydroxy-6-hydroxymethyldihydropteridine diphosphokinase [Candidatus Polarisedimenticolaceae bacterium]|nr:2-amino-4-hydroxy-6-hydroxymethyldihydropteridine diphosphokinase [Candidatus Polarisedimenticolaceae bacterium]